MDTSPIFDYIENVKGITPNKVTHVEDVIETHPENADHVTCIYSLFSIDCGGDKEELFVQIASSSANVALPADETLLQEFFPEYAQNPIDNAEHPDGSDAPGTAAGSD